MSVADWMELTGRIMNLVVGFVTITVAWLYLTDWAIGRIGRHIKAYSMLIEFAFYYKKFKKWQKESNP